MIFGRGWGKMKGCFFLREETCLTGYSLASGFLNLGLLTHCNEGDGHHGEAWGVSVKKY